MIANNDIISKDIDIAQSAELPEKITQILKKQPTPYLTDLSNAECFVQQFGHQVRYVPSRGWYLFNGTHWQLDLTDQILGLAHTSLQSYYDQVAALDGQDGLLAQRLLKHAARSASLPRLTALLQLARTLPGITLPYTSLDSHPFLLSVLNGTLDLRTATLRPHHPDDYITHLVPIEYDPQSHSTVWETFLSRLTSSSIEQQSFFQRAVGYTLTGHTQEAACFLLTGPGYQAQRLLLALLRQLFGSYGGHLSAVQRRQFTPAVLETRLLTTSTSAFLTLRNYATLAALIEAEPVTLRQTAFQPACKLWLSSPDVPELPKKLAYLDDHLKQIPITLSLSPREAYLLEEQLQPALPAILAWAVQGCLLWQEQGLDDLKASDISPTTFNTEAALSQEPDELTPFFEMCCTQDPSFTITAHELYRAYTLWVRIQPVKRLSEAHFTRLVEAHGFSRAQKSKGHCYRGLTLKVPLKQLSAAISKLSLSSAN